MDSRCPIAHCIGIVDECILCASITKQCSYIYHYKLESEISSFPGFPTLLHNLALTEIPNVQVRTAN